MFRQITFISLAAALVLSLGGCAHPISMAPNLDAIPTAAGKSTPSKKKVGFYIADSATAQEVTTPGGGGDKVRYFPYRDLEPGLYKALGTVFRDVTKIKNPADAAEIRASGIQLLITPEITTDSSSSSPFTWPPTAFTVSAGPTNTPVRCIGCRLAPPAVMRCMESLMLATGTVR